MSTPRSGLDQEEETRHHQNITVSLTIYNCTLRDAILRRDDEGRPVAMGWVESRLVQETSCFVMTSLTSTAPISSPFRGLSKRDVSLLVEETEDKQLENVYYL